MVRATFAGFSTAFSALQANQKRLDIVGQNLSNMNTVGYTRQELKVSSFNYTNPMSHYMRASEVSVGFGVHMDTVAQIRDPYLDIQYREQMQKSGYSNALQTSYEELAKFLDESHINGINMAFNEIQSTLTEMSDLQNADTAVYETELRTRMQALTNLINDAARQIDTAKKNEYSRLDGTGTSEQGAIDTVNDILQQIGRLNRQIKDNQIYGQPSLELMDERNVLLDELSSYIPIEVTYYKDSEHDGLGADGKYDATSTAQKGEKYHLDSAGNIIMKKEWPDDLRVTMNYIGADGTSKKIVLVEGTVGTGDENFGQLRITNSDNILNGDDPSTLRLEFEGCFHYPVIGQKGSMPSDKPYGLKRTNSLVFRKKDTEITNQFPANSGSIQASLDMLWQDGGTTGKDALSRVNGYDYYMNQLDNLAASFAYVINTINSTNFEVKDGGNLLTDIELTDVKGAAKKIGIHSDWISGNSWVRKNGNTGINGAETDSRDAIMDMLEAMQTVFHTDSGKNASNFLYSDGTPKYPELNDINLENNTFANFMNHVSTVLANDTYSNQNSLKTNVTVLNGIQNSRDSVSGVSLDEEASNMMMYMSAYNAASRLMTTLDQALDTLINSTGVVGR